MSSSNKICELCKTKIEGGQTLTETDKKYFHRECFVCDECKKPIEGKFFTATKHEISVNVCQDCRMKEMPSRNCSTCGRSVSVEDSIVYDNKIFHRKCFVCMTCNKPIESKMPFKLCVLNKDGLCKPECKDCAEKSFNHVCYRCNKKLPVEGQYIHSDEKYWHVDCFCCSKCHKKIVDGKFREIDDKGTIQCTACSS
ncbi:hypothetical protein GJ496_004530 [Pomphorhynchus laevis]|nr:hypothetical protein GJ496_004530 [Pomphorhynchus laevis]